MYCIDVFLNWFKSNFQVDNTTSTKHEFPIYFLGSEIVVAGKLDKETVKDNTTIGELSGVSTDGIHRFPIIVDKVHKPHSVGKLFQKLVIYNFISLCFSD